MARCTRRFDNQIFQAAVAAWRELPVECKLEVAVLRRGDDVAAGTRPFAFSDAPDCSVLNDPALGREAVGMEAAPPVGGVTVEQQFPSGCLLGGCQRVRSLGALLGRGPLRRRSCGLLLCRQEWRPGHNPCEQARGNAGKGTTDAAVRGEDGRAHTHVMLLDVGAVRTRPVHYREFTRRNARAWCGPAGMRLARRDRA